VNSQQPEEKSSRPKVMASFEDADGFRCVDVFQHSDGTYGFKEFRRDPEDAGRWTLVGDYSHRSFPSKEEALDAAANSLVWFAVIHGKLNGV
jgi:hypothetical protein